MRWIVLLILVCKFNLGYWVSLTPQERQGIKMSYALEFAQKFMGKARVYEVIQPQEWQVLLYAEAIEQGV